MLPRVHIQLAGAKTSLVRIRGRRVTPNVRRSHRRDATADHGLAELQNLEVSIALIAVVSLLLRRILMTLSTDEPVSNDFALYLGTSDGMKLPSRNRQRLPFATCHSDSEDMKNLHRRC